MKRCIALVCLFFFCFAIFPKKAVSQEEAEDPQQEPAEITDETKIREPEPYTDEEFPQ